MEWTGGILFARCFQVVSGEDCYLQETCLRFGKYAERIRRVYLVGADPFALSAARLLDRIREWADDGVLRVNYRPHQQLQVIRTALPSFGGAPVP